MLQEATQISQGSKMQLTFDKMAFWAPEDPTAPSALGRPCSDGSGGIGMLRSTEYSTYLHSLAKGAFTVCVAAAGRDDRAWDRALRRISPQLVGVGNGGVPRGYHQGTVLLRHGGRQCARSC